MRKQFLKAVSLSMLAAALLFTACSKDGERGPQGEKGEKR